MRYVTSPGSIVRKHDASITVGVNTKVVARLPLAALTRLVTVGRVQLTSDAMRALLTHRVPTSMPAIPTAGLPLREESSS